MYNGTEDVTEQIQELKENKVEQITSYLAITEGGKLNSIGYNFSDEAN